MDSIARDIYRAIHEDKWLSVEYRNVRGEVTRFWVGITGMSPRKRTLQVRAFHLGTHDTQDLNSIDYDSILSCSVVDGSYFPGSGRLAEHIDDNPDLYSSLFGHVPNLRVLDYYEDCSKLDATPFTKDFGLVSHVDMDTFDPSGETLQLTEDQFAECVEAFQKKAYSRRKKNSKPAVGFDQLALNLLSIQTRRGIYVLAYRKMRLDVEKRTLEAEDGVVLCREFGVSDGKVVTKVPIRRYLDESDSYLLEDFLANAEEIKNRIMPNLGEGELLSDMPYLTVIARNQAVDLCGEYAGICDMYEDDRVTPPIRAFFGEITQRTNRGSGCPLVLASSRVNFDQLLVMESSLSLPLTYVQGPPGTGKTTTIVNAIVSAFANGRSVLFCSNNNHPVDGVCESLLFSYEGQEIELPFLRIGNAAVTARTLDALRGILETVDSLEVPEFDTAAFLSQRAERSQDLMRLLAKYEEVVDLQERCECIEALLRSGTDRVFGLDLAKRQLQELSGRLSQLRASGGTLEEALELIGVGDHEVSKCLFTLTVNCLKRLREPANGDIVAIIESKANPIERARKFHKLLQSPSALRRVIRIFPIIATTCISAHKLGKPQPAFDLTIIDEASQCLAATALIPIVRGASLMLVGDPQQLSPVTLLDKEDNAALRRGYRITDEYDYISQSIYKTFLACDAVSDEILLSHHYRCDEQIIEFNNRKYYRGRLKVDTNRKDAEALTFVDVRNDYSQVKNTAPAESDYVVEYARSHPEESIGVITPFVNQREYMARALQERGIENATVGTIHSFQGDEKDVVLVSTALTNNTSKGTYRWLANNHELINVATSRAKNKLIVVGNQAALDSLHSEAEGEDDVYELVEYVKSKGTTEVSEHASNSRSLGVKPYSTKTESAFLETLNHALGNIAAAEGYCTVRREVPISHVFDEGEAEEWLFYSGKFDFVVYEEQPGGGEMPLLAIELDGKEHRSDAAVIARDRQKNEICARHGFLLIRVDNTYARRYQCIKGILEDFFEHGQ